MRPRGVEDAAPYTWGNDFPRRGGVYIRPLRANSVRPYSLFYYCISP